MSRSVGLWLITLLCVLLCSCSDDNEGSTDAGLDAIVDLPPKSQWTQCPKTFFEADGKACVGANHCDYGGCAPPGNYCDCKQGLWYCLHINCPDRGPDMPLPDA